MKDNASSRGQTRADAKPLRDRWPGDISTRMRPISAAARRPEVTRIDKRKCAFNGKGGSIDPPRPVGKTGADPRTMKREDCRFGSCNIVYLPADGRPQSRLHTWNQR